MTRSELGAAIETILKIPQGSLKESDSRDTIESWSSFADADILTYVATATGIEPEAELLEAETYGDMLRVLESKGVLP